MNVIEPEYKDMKALKRPRVYNDTHNKFYNIIEQDENATEHTFKMTDNDVNPSIFAKQDADSKHQRFNKKIKTESNIIEDEPDKTISELYGDDVVFMEPQKKMVPTFVTIEPEMQEDKMDIQEKPKKVSITYSQEEKKLLLKQFYKLRALSIFLQDSFELIIENMLYTEYMTSLISVIEWINLNNAKDINLILSELTNNSQINPEDNSIYTSFESVINVLTEENIDKRGNKSTKQLGGLSNSSLKQQLKESLDYKIADSQHDFGKARNKYYPESIYQEKHSAETSRLTLNQLIRDVFYGNNKYKKADDLLFNYFDSKPTNFEESVKVDFLSGELVGDLYNITYYFSENMPSTWEETRVQFLEKLPEEILSIGESAASKLIADLDSNANDEWYYMFDACLSSRIHGNIGGKEAYTLAKLWDPIKAGKIKKEELFEDIKSRERQSKTRFVGKPEVSDEYTGNTYKIYDWENIEMGNSIYDEVYYDLLNPSSFIENGIKIQIRLAVDQNNYSSIFIEVLQNDTTKFADVIDSGFSVKELSIGLYYIETGALLSRESRGIENKMKKLTRFIDKLRSLLQGTPDINNVISNVLIRFKSSGDHGQSKFCKYINTALNDFCLFISGDNLAYVEAMALEDLPVLARYYSPSSKKSDEHDNSDEDGESCEISGPFFLAAYLPTGNNIEKILARFNEQINTIGTITKKQQTGEFIKISELVGEVDNLPLAIGALQEELTVINKNIDEKMDVFDPNSEDNNAKKQLMNMLNTILETLIQSLFLRLKKILTVKFAETDAPKLKHLLEIVIDFTDNLYVLYLWRSGRIKKIYNKFEEYDRELLTNTLGLQPETNVEPYATTFMGRIRRSVSNKVSGFKNTMINNLKTLFKGRMSQPSTSEIAKVMPVEIDNLKKLLKKSSEDCENALKDKFRLKQPVVDKLKKFILFTKLNMQKDFLDKIRQIPTIGKGISEIINEKMSTTIPSNANENPKKTIGKMTKTYLAAKNAFKSVGSKISTVIGLNKGGNNSVHFRPFRVQSSRFSGRNEWNSPDTSIIDHAKRRTALKKSTKKYIEKSKKVNRKTRKINSRAGKFTKKTNRRNRKTRKYNR
jgi:hypothetical protein